MWKWVRIPSKIYFFNAKVQELNRRPREIYNTPFPLQQLNSSYYITPNTIYKETLGDAMAPAYSQRDPPLSIPLHF